MKTLRIQLTYGSTFPSSHQRGGAPGVALPVTVLDTQGTILADVIASSQNPAEVELHHQHGPIFIRLTWPSGRTETEKVDLDSSQDLFNVTFSDAHISQSEWSAWAIPRLATHSQLTGGDQSVEGGIDHYANVWLRIWRFKNAQWSTVSIAPEMQYKNEAARQVDLHLGRYPHLLQIGGSDVPWRFVSLPGGGPCRILLTPNSSKNPRADPLKVIVTSFRLEEETLLEFLTRDSVREATTMAESEAMAYELFAHKFNDPIAAVIGGYFLLRTERWERVPLSWWKNLSRFSWVPDTAIIHCVRLLRGGLSDDDSRTAALQLFKKCLDRGWPVYDEGLQLLREAGSLLKRIANEDDAPYFSRVDSLNLAKSWAGSMLSFYGKDPAIPSVVQWIGMPDAPLRRHLAGGEGVNQARNMPVLETQGNAPTDVWKKSRQLTSLSFINEFYSHPTTPAPITPEVTQEFEDIVSDSYSGRRSLNTKPETKTTKARKKGSSWMLLGDIGN